MPVGFPFPSLIIVLRDQMLPQSRQSNKIKHFKSLSQNHEFPQQIHTSRSFFSSIMLISEYDAAKILQKKFTKLFFQSNFHIELVHSGPTDDKEHCVR